MQPLDDLDALAAAALDLHEGICDPRERGCKRWPEELRLRSKLTGETFPGRCRATNLCPYCRTLYVVETVEMLVLDAMEYAPTLWAVLTAREHLTRRDTYGHLRQLRRVARKRWAAIEWFVQVEFQRRGALHLNLLIKGVPVSDLEALHQVLVGRWCERVDARPRGQWSDTVHDARGVSLYLSKMLAHGLKAEQAPPLGWRGHRTSQTRGYLVRPASEMRVEARDSLRVKRRLWKARRAAQGTNADYVETIYGLLEEHDRELAEAGYELVYVNPSASRAAERPAPLLGRVERATDGATPGPASRRVSVGGGPGAPSGTAVRSGRLAGA